ncbi:hypothetical protein K492DRAFT_238557 [Lichtheimia hyalospora FSU 10163]|nr:hypothetical protein K492DRAFT_238557 [Lichtheimia hyalospora FSU 10163]
MIPRLPPLLLALLGGASIYGIKAVLDRLDPPAIGPPGSSERAQRMLKYKDYARRGSIVAVAAGFAWAGYWMYDKRTHRPMPASQSGNKEEAESFYRDQYSDRERRFQQEQLKARDEQRQREALARARLMAEQISMEEQLPPVSSSSPTTTATTTTNNDNHNDRQ